MRCSAESGFEPTYESDLAAGADLRASLDSPLLLEAGGRAVVGTGVRLALSPGMEAQIRPRSGLALRHGVTVLNSPGTVDADYRGEIRVILINHGTEAFEIVPGARIAQMVIATVERARFTVVDNLDSTDRGEGGFGSTGT